MYSRWSNAAVVILWLSAMSWLLVEKVLPPLLVGEPPSYRTILKAQRGEPPVGWKMSFDGRRLGWAVSTITSLPDDITEVYSWVHFDQLPLDDLAPGWLRSLVRSAEQTPSLLTMDAKNTTWIDPLGHLSSFKSEVRVTPLSDAIRMQGTIEGNQLKFEIRTGGLSYEMEAQVPQDALLSDALSPRTQLPGIRPGQRWTVPVYSPLRPPSNPLEILQAEVDGSEPIVWNNRTVETLLVVYHSDAVYGLGSRERPRGKLWVRPDGTVLRQQVMIFNSTMTFVRMSDEEAAALVLEKHINADQHEDRPR
jgi:hypothetical protein